MPDVEQFVLAALSGVGFGIVIRFLHTTWQQLGLFMLLLWTMQTGPQYVYRWLDGQDVTREVVNVTVLRLVFTVTACIVVAIATHRRGQP